MQKKPGLSLETLTSRYRLGLGIIRLYSIEILGRLSISAENRDFCLFLNSLALTLKNMNAIVMDMTKE